MSENSGWCRILVRNADDPEVAAEALGRFRDDLWTSDLFAPLDGEFGNDVDGTPLRYTPASATEVQLGAERPEFSFDAQDTLVTWPELVDDLIRQLRERLRGAGVRRAEIGKPRRPYSERAYVAEADWFHGSGQYLEPLHAKWLPSRFPDRFPIPAIHAWSWRTKHATGAGRTSHGGGEGSKMTSAMYRLAGTGMGLSSNQ